MVMSTSKLLPIGLTQTFGQEVNRHVRHCSADHNVQSHQNNTTSINATYTPRFLFGDDLATSDYVLFMNTATIVFVYSFFVTSAFRLLLIPWSEK